METDLLLRLLLEQFPPKAYLWGMHAILNGMPLPHIVFTGFFKILMLNASPFV